MPDDFSVTMKELSAAAERKVNGHANGHDTRDHESLAAMMREFHGLNASVQNLETTLTRRLEQIERSVKPADESAQFAKIEEHLSAIRKSESVNQRLFDSLHDELLTYRDNFLHESLHKPFIRDLIVLFDDLSALSDQMATTDGSEQKRSRMTQWRQNLDNAVHALIEILNRLEVTEVEAKERVDLSVHKVVSYEPAEYIEDEGRIVMRLKRGFMWRGKVLRPAEIIAKKFE